MKQNYFKDSKLNLKSKTDLELFKADIDLSKPSKPEHLTGLWIDGMTRAERKKAVMNYYLCSKNTAIKWMRMFNLWDEPEYVDYKAKYEEALKEIEELKQRLAMKEEVIKFINENLI